MPQRGQYALEQQVAEGSTGVVWRARHVELGSLAAVKVLKPDLYEDPTVRERFLREARVLAGLDHPGIVQVLDVGDDWIALEWVQGAPLDEVLEAHGPLQPAQAVAVVRGALLGLERAHALGVVHGDVATSNVLLSDSGSSMLVDFGLACPTGSPGVCGTPAFVSPEGASGEHLTPASDVWSAGAVLYLLLTGAPVLPAADVEGVLQRHRYEIVPALPRHGAHLAGVLAKAMAFVPLDRYPEAGAFVRALDEAAERQWGVAWLAGAGLAGLSVSHATGAAGGAGAAAAAGANAAAPVGSSAAVDTGALPAAAPPPLAPRKRRRVPKAPAIAAVVVVAVTAIATPIVLHHDSVTTAAPSALVPTGLSASASTPTSAGTGVRQLTADITETSYLGRLACAPGQVVTRAALTVGADEIPLTYVGSDVWEAALTPAQGTGGSAPEAVPHGDCGDTAPVAQPDALHDAEVPVETPAGLDGSNRPVQVVATVGADACRFGAPVLRVFWLHGLIPSSQPFTTGGFAFSKNPDVVTTPMRDTGNGTFVYDLTDAEFLALSSNDAQPDRTFTSSQYGDCDYAHTPPYTG